DNHSCEDNLVRLEHDCHWAQLDNKYLVAVFWTSAQHLTNYGENKSITKRRIRRTIETANGCPQGSVLSLIIFSLFMNTLRDAIENSNSEIQNPAYHSDIFQFVDDGAIWTVSKKPEIAVENIQHTLKTMETWILIVHKQRVKPPESSPYFLKLKLCNQTLTYNENAIFLGLTFNKYLKWDLHINSLIAR
ncbi:hypothetical protein MAR_007524, partial [Mya arenaria]